MTVIIMILHISIQYNKLRLTCFTEDIDPSVGRFRNMVQTTVIPKKVSITGSHLVGLRRKDFGYCYCLREQLFIIKGIIWYSYNIFYANSEGFLWTSCVPYMFCTVLYYSSAAVYKHPCKSWSKNPSWLYISQSLEVIGPGAMSKLPTFTTLHSRMWCYCVRTHCNSKFTWFSLQW